MTEDKKELNSPILDETQPHQIHAPSFKGTGIKMVPPFKNDYGVVIGDSLYASANSPLENWDENTDPEIMSGEQWIHPTNDIGWNRDANKDILEDKKFLHAAPFTHPTKDTSLGTD